jgi:hypothetical protein
VHRWQNRNRRSKLSEEANNMQRSKLRRDSVMRCADEIPYIKAQNNNVQNPHLREVATKNISLESVKQLV